MTKEKSRYILNQYDELHLFFTQDDVEDLQLWDHRTVPPDLRLPDSMIESQDLVLPQTFADLEPPALELPMRWPN